MSNTKNDTASQDFEAMMEQRIRENFSAPAQTGATATNDRLKEASKKLPSWSLEPPYSFLK